MKLPILGTEPIDFCTSRVPLIRMDGTIEKYAIIDTADAPLVGQYAWQLSIGYAGRNEGNRRVLMHRFIMGITASGRRIEVDHRDRDRLNNRRSNLRVVSHAQNSQNLPSMGGTSSFRGVSWHKAARKWVAYAELSGMRHHLGLFLSEAEAAAAVSRWRAAHMPYSVEPAA